MERIVPYHAKIAEVISFTLFPEINRLFGGFENHGMRLPTHEEFSSTYFLLSKAGSNGGLLVIPSSKQLYEIMIGTGNKEGHPFLSIGANGESQLYNRQKKDITSSLDKLCRQNFLELVPDEPLLILFSGDFYKLRYRIISSDGRQSRSVKRDLFRPGKEFP